MKTQGEKKIVLVTGGCGYIGSHTILELIRQTDFIPVSIDNLVNSFEDSLHKIKEITGVEVKNHAIDLCDEEGIKGIQQLYTGKVAGIIHFAALKSVPESVAFPLKYYKNNIGSLVNVLSLAQGLGIEAFIFSSSCSVYGNVNELPVKESTPLMKAESPYAQTKQMGEDVIYNVVPVSEFKAISLRYFNPVGADATAKIGERPRDGNVNNLVPVITQTAAGVRNKMVVYGNDYGTRDGSCIRDYIHVTDIANAHVMALKYIVDGKMAGKYDVFNLGTGNGVTVLEAIKAFEKCAGVTLNYEIVKRREGDVEAIYSNSEKVFNQLKWSPKYGIDEMMSTAWEWQKNILKGM